MTEQRQYQECHAKVDETKGRMVIPDQDNRTAEGGGHRLPLVLPLHSVCQGLEGERLKPREVDSIPRSITDGEVGATGDQLRKTRSRLQKGEKDLSTEYIEVTTTVSAADVVMRGKFAHYTGEALKKEEKSSIRIIPKHSENSDK